MNNCKIICYLGVDSKVGTTMVSQSLAQLLNGENQKVLLICKFVEGESEYLAGSTLHNLKTMSWDELDLFNDNLHPKEIQKVLGNLSEDYEIMILDLGHNANNPVAVGALQIAHLASIVTTEQRSSRYKLQQLIHNLITPMDIRPRLLINKYIEGAFWDYKSLEINEKFQGIDVIRYNPYGWQAEEEKKTLLYHPIYNKDLRKYEKTIRSI